MAPGAAGQREFRRHLCSPAGNPVIRAQPRTWSAKLVLILPRRFLVDAALGRDRFEPPSVPRVASRSLGLEPPSETGQIVCCQTQPLYPVRTLAIL